MHSLPQWKVPQVMDKHLEKNRSSIPSVDKLLGSAPCKDLLTQFGRAQVTDSIRIILSEIRDSLNDSSVPDVAPDMQEIAARVQVRL